MIMTPACDSYHALPNVRLFPASSCVRQRLLQRTRAGVEGVARTFGIACCRTHARGGIFAYVRCQVLPNARPRQEPEPTGTGPAREC